MNFSELNLSAPLTESIKRMGFTEATPIQEAAIPLALEGKDILGSAQTGTGKTAAFSIPAVEYLIKNKKSRVLVLTPTRELAKQVLDNIKQLLGNGALPIKTAFIIGGESMGKQLQQLRNNPQIIVGTPGRVNDHLERRTLDLSKAGFLVLDETDRMLDMGFGVQLDRIIPHMKESRQTLLFSATLPKQILKLANKYQTNPERVSMGDTNTIATTIKQEVKHIEAHQKYDQLVEEIHERAGSIIIFAKTKFGAEKMAKKLSGEGFKADTLHGGLRQNKRNTVMHKFREKKFRVLVATDVAARGLDVPHIEHVINFDLPQAAEDYIHRMGRTGRNGAEGSALSFVTKADGGKWRAIQRFIDPNAKDTGNDNWSNDNRRDKGNRKKSFKSGSRPSGKFGGKGSTGNRGRSNYNPIEGLRENRDGEQRKPFKKSFNKPYKNEEHSDQQPKSRVKGRNENFKDKPAKTGSRTGSSFNSDKPKGKNGFKPDFKKGAGKPNPHQRSSKKPFSKTFKKVS